MLKRFLILSVVILLSALSSVAQIRNISYHNLTPDNGLSNITVNGIYQDHNKAIWLATRDGLNCYDGSTVKVFRQNKDNSNSLLSNNVNRITGDGVGNIYVLCNDGISMFNVDTERFTTLIEDKVSAIYWHNDFYAAFDNSIERWDADEQIFRHYFAHPNPDVSIRSMLVDSEGRMWIGTQDHGIFTLEKSGKLMHRLEVANISQIREDRHGDIWFGTWTKGLYHYDIESGKLENFRRDPSNEDSLPTNFIRDIAEDDIGNFWLATNIGLCHYNTKDQIFEMYPGSDNTDSIWNIIRDAQGNIWFGTDFGGASWFNPEYTIFVRYNMGDSQSSNVDHTIIGRIIEDQDDMLWICAERGGIYLYDRHNGTFTQMLDEDGNHIASDIVKAIYHDTERGVVWIGSWSNGLYRYNIATREVKNFRYDPTWRWSLSSNMIIEIEPFKDKLLLGTYKGGILLFDPLSEQCERLFTDTPSGRKITTVGNILVDRNEKLWISAEGYGLFTYSFSEDILTNYRHNSTIAGSISSNNVSALVEDQEGTIWIGHEGAGVDRYAVDSDSFENFDSKSSRLVGNRIYQICDNLDGTLSISTGEGLSIFNCTSHESRNYSNRMGYSIFLPTENAMCRTHDNVLFIGGVDGLISFDINKFTSIPKRNYKLKLSSLYVNQKAVAVGDQGGILSKILPSTSSITLPHTTSSFSVNFATTNYIPEIDEPILYRLNGFDDEWLEPHGNMITYTNIPPGNYTLALKSAAGSEYIDGATLDIAIRSIWYNTAWAWLIYMIISAALINYLLMLYRQRLKLSAQVRYEQERIVEVERQNQSKLQFFTNISHEFRTPLSVIIGQIEQLLRSKQINGVSRSKVLSIYRSSKELNSLIGELLDFRKHEKGMLKLNIQRANLTDMISEIYEIYNDYISSRGVSFELVTPQEPIVIPCDVAQIRKVVNNLISNAIKYTKRGDSISLAIRQGNENVVISIKDSGTGIAAHDMQHIFDRFYQGTSNKSVTSSGTGIGLAFAKGIIDLHKGNIDVFSREGEGCLFTVMLPSTLQVQGDDIARDDVADESLLLMAPVDVPELLSTEDNDSQKATKILIVEDDCQLLEMLVDIFSPQYSVTTAADGAEGIERAKELQPQIIVSDVMMPIKSGIELCTTLKNDPATSHIAIVLLTARSTTEQTIEGLNCGADDYIVKPFNTNLLLARCNNLVNNRVRLQESFGKQPEENTIRMATNSLDQKILERAMAIIDNHIDNPEFDIATFSNEIAMSRTNLFNKIKAITGLTPNDFIMTVRLKRAATLLLSNPEMGIGEVAERVGFSGHRYFSRRFKERFGVTPAAYRQGN